MLAAQVSSVKERYRAMRIADIHFIYIILVPVFVLLLGWMLSTVHNTCNDKLLFLAEKLQRNY